MKKNRYPLPSIDDFFDQLVGSPLDFISLGSQTIALIRQHLGRPTDSLSGRLCHLGLPITNAPAYFVDLMSCVFQDVLIKFVVVFVDGILVFSKSTRELVHLEEVLRTLCDHQSKAKFLKCHFWREEVRFSGHREGHHMERI